MSAYLPDGGEGGAVADGCHVVPKHLPRIEVVAHLVLLTTSQWNADKSAVMRETETDQAAEQASSSRPTFCLA